MEGERGRKEERGEEREETQMTCEVLFQIGENEEGGVNVKEDVKGRDAKRRIEEKKVLWKVSL